MPRLPDIADVLAGRARVDLSTLVSLVHSVNPTDRGLSAREEAARYAQKSALQSLLLRRFPEQVVLRPDPRDDDICTLHVPIDGRDAGHARISTLDEDLLPAVRSALAAVPDRSPARPEPARKARVAEPLDPQGLADDGDFAGAAAAWLARAALGDVRAAREALTLWVDWLGEPEPARAAYATLPAPVRADGICRSILARAEVRSGAHDAAERLLGSDRGEEIGAAWRELADAALAAGDKERARRACQRMLEADPGTRQAALAIEAKLGAEDEARRAALRSAVDAAEGDAATAAALADLEAAFPGDRHAARVRAALAADRAEAAERKRLSDAREAASRQRDERIAAVRAALGTGANEAGIAGWLELDPAAREQAAAGLDTPALRFAEEIGARSREPAETVARAALAVVAADGLPADDVLALLAPHAGLLVGAARRLWSDATREVEARRQRDAGVALAGAADALAAGDVEGARARLAAVPRAGLTAEQREALAARLAELELADAEAAAIRQFDVLLGREPWRARDLAAARGAGWGARADDASAEILTHLRFRDLGAAGSLPVIPHIGTLAHDGRPMATIDEGGASMLLWEALGAHLAVHCVSTADLTPLQTVILRLPSIARLARLTVRDGVAWVETSGGLLLALDPAALTPLRWTRFEPRARVEVVDDGVWILSRDFRWSRIDAASFRAVPAGRLEPGRGVPGGEVLLRKDTNTYSVLTPAGTRLAARAPVPHQSRTVATDGRRVLVAAGIPRGNNIPPRLQLWILEDGEQVVLCDLGVVAGPVWLALQGDTAWAGWFEGDSMRLRAVDLPTRDELWRAELPADTLLFQAPSGGPVAALVLGAVRGELHWLDEGPSRLPGVPAKEVGVRTEVPLIRKCDVTPEDARFDPAAIQAQERYLARDWAGVAAAVAAAPRRTDHLAHLDGLAALFMGELDRAEDTLRSFTRVEPACDVREILPVCGAVFANAKPGSTGADMRAVRVLRHHAACVAAADAALAKGDFAAAWRAVDDPPGWHADCAQLAGRRVAAVLGMADPPVLWVLRALASLESATGDVPGVATWPTARLDALAGQARAWVEAWEAGG